MLKIVVPKVWIRVVSGVSLLNERTAMSVLIARLSAQTDIRKIYIYIPSLYLPPLSVRWGAPVLPGVAPETALSNSVLELDSEMLRRIYKIEDFTGVPTLWYEATFSDKENVSVLAVLVWFCSCFTFANHRVSCCIILYGDLKPGFFA